MRLLHLLDSLLFLFYSLIFLESLNAYQVDNNAYRHIEWLDKEGKYQLEWLVDWEESRVIFNVTVKTKGYVGLGLSRKGKMSGADIVIGGVLPSGQPYFSDRHAIANQLPVEDPSQDWELHFARETNTHTILSFSRPFETCDEDHDLPIHGDVIGLLWAFGEKDDDIEYHHQNRGVFYVYLLDADLTPRELKETEQSGISNGDKFGDWKVWRIEQTDLVPTKETTYLCNLHRAPSGNGVQHIVGFRSILPTELGRRHLHHYLLYRCIPPAGQDSSFFAPFVRDKDECYLLDQPVGRIPTEYCLEVAHVWGVGQKPNFFPDHVGVPLYSNEYYMLQVHLDNPDLIPGLQVSHALEIFYTDRLREHDAGLLAFGLLTPASPSIMVPPNSLAHEIYGHCAAGCTESMFPPSGIRVFASFLHTHLAGRGARRIHIRDGKELPWISYDDNYNFNYQQLRILREERVILPGDTLIDRCVYENTDREGNVTVGGFSTRHEMCAGFLWYYNKIPYRSVCCSEIRSEEYHNFLQIRNTTWSNAEIENVVTSPPQNAGLLVSEVGNLRTDWTLAKRKQLQEYHRSLPQVSLCPSVISNDNGRAVRSRFDTRSSQKRPPLVPQRYALPSLTRPLTTPRPSYPLRRQSVQRNFEGANLSGATRGQGQPSEIKDPETEFVSIYPKDIVRYKRPSVCSYS